MDKDTLKELLKEYLNVQIWTEYDIVDECYYVHTEIMFDGDVISEDSFNMSRLIKNNHEEI